MPYLYVSFSAKEPGARGDACPLERTRVMRIVQIGECIEISIGGIHSPIDNFSTPPIVAQLWSAPVGARQQKHSVAARPEGSCCMYFSRH